MDALGSPHLHHAGNRDVLVQLNNDKVSTMEKTTAQQLEEYEAALKATLPVSMNSLGVTAQRAGNIRCWASDISSQEGPDFAVGLEWFDPLKEANIVGTFPKDWAHEIRDNNGDGEDSAFYTNAADEYASLATCMRDFVDDFILTVRDRIEVYEKGLKQQPL